MIPDNDNRYIWFTDFVALLAVFLAGAILSLACAAYGEYHYMNERHEDANYQEVK